MRLIVTSLGNYVTPAVWSAAEASIALVNACLPSMRPLFAQVIRRRSHKLGMSSQSSQRCLTASWRYGKGKNSYDGSFNRLPEPSHKSWGWSNNVAVAVHGGQAAGGEEYDIGEASSQPNAPMKGIMVKTTVVQEISERLNYHDELF